MENQIKASIINETDTVADKAINAGAVDQDTLKKLYSSAYDNMPNGGFPHRSNEILTYKDGSTLTTAIADGIAKTKADEYGPRAHCDSNRDEDGHLDFQKIYQCMRAVHGGVVSQKSSFDDGKGFTMSHQSSDYVLAGINFGQQEYKTNSTFKSGELTIVKNEDKNDGSISLVRTLPDGSKEQLDLSRSPARDRTAEVKLNAVKIEGADGKVLKSKTW